MNGARWLLAIVVAMLLIAPMSIPSSEATTSSEVSVSILGFDIDPMVEDVPLKLESGQSLSLVMFVVNKSSNRYSVYLDTEFSADGKVHVEGVDISSAVLKPAGSPDSEDIVTMTISVRADPHIFSGDRYVPLDLHLQDLDDSQYSIVEMGMDVTVTSTLDMGGCYNKFIGFFPNTLPGELGQPWFTAMVSVVLIVMIVWAICLIMLPLTMAILKVNKKGEDYDHLRKRVLLVTLLISTLVAINTSLLIYGIDSDTYHVVELISNVIYTILGAVLVWNVYLFIITRVVGKVETTLNNMESSLIPLFKLLGRLIIAVAAVTIILASFGVDLAGLLVSAGVVSLGITLGAQNVLGQFFSGLTLLATRPFKAGDFIQIDDDVFIVKRVGLMYSEFNNWGKDQIVTIPNNVVSSSTILNLTRGNKVARVNVYITVAYNTDIEKAKELMIQAANSNPHVVLDGSFGKPSVTLMDWISSGIQLRLSCYVDDFDASKGITGQLRESVTELFRANGIEIPYSRVQIDILSDRSEA